MATTSHVENYNKNFRLGKNHFYEKVVFKSQILIVTLQISSIGLSSNDQVI